MRFGVDFQVLWTANENKPNLYAWNILSDLKSKDTLVLQKNLGPMAQFKKQKLWPLRTYPGQNWRWNVFARYGLEEQDQMGEQTQDEEDPYFQVHTESQSV